ncbi:RidA family protein [Pseudomonas sp. GD04087]|uniref:RidA family protein n=1 Tax=unclassified Pseudomonas TaxID=196821 RepID=UPI002448F2B7|nr:MULTISPECIES: RidA family protein [unclassified Pseudomonas]MDH0290140.1 RidA family protein [Pseudomonas sp. GD04087]MDH1046956.1 RidA family protein [Pseudomonas sp. GD03903]MDH1999963.1 RidA family protein [Pseudomonas sp. GD03691]
MSETRAAALDRIAAELGYDFSGEIKIGGNYVPFLIEGNQVHLSGQIPRVGDEVVVTGRAGSAVSLADAQLAAKVCVMRALALLRQALGDLDNVRRVLQLNVFVQSAEHFTQQSEVADGASAVLYEVLGAAGVHTRTSVGVYQLPKNATVELSLLAVAEDLAR